MGKSYTPKYRLEVDGAFHGFWERRHGKPTVANLEKRLTVYVESLKVGGVNEHISKALGRIPYPRTARIVRQEDKHVMAEWEAGEFQAW